LGRFFTPRCEASELVMYEFDYAVVARVGESESDEYTQMRIGVTFPSNQPYAVRYRHQLPAMCNAEHIKTRIVAAVVSGSDRDGRVSSFCWVPSSQRADDDYLSATNSCSMVTPRLFCAADSHHRATLVFRPRSIRVSDCDADGDSQINSHSHYGERIS